MEDQKPFLTDLKEDLTKYLDLRLQYIKLSAFEKISKLASALVSVIIILFFSLFGTLFLFLTLAIYMGDLTGNRTMGFAIVSGFFIVMLLLYFAFGKKSLEQKITNKIVDILANDDDEETHK